MLGCNFHGYITYQHGEVSYVKLDLGELNNSIALFYLKVLPAILFKDGCYYLLVEMISIIVILSICPALVLYFLSLGFFGQRLSFLSAICVGMPLEVT